MSKKRKICLAIIIVASVAGIYFAFHLAAIHYKKPKHQLNLINTLPLMEHILDREKIEKTATEQEIANLVAPTEDENFDPYAEHQKATGKNSAGEEACDISETLSCTAVDETEYSELFGIALSIYGMAGYLLLIILSVICLLRKKEISDVFSFLLFYGSWAGFLFSAYLTWLETFVIKAFCPYCVVSAVAMTIILACVLVAYGFSPLRILAQKKR